MEEVIVIGSGLGSLTAAALLAQKGLKPTILEQNWIPGGCTTSYSRKGFVFEAGATTLVGLDENMPLRQFLDQTGIQIETRKLKLPMQVHLADGRIVNKYQNIKNWISEAEKHFGGNQKTFWENTYQLSQFVWEASTRYLDFTPSKPVDFLRLAAKARVQDILKARYSLVSTASRLPRNQPDDQFKQYIDQQLLITAQNTAREVNFLFGAAALCYTNYSNHYIDGGLINLVNPILKYIRSKGGTIFCRNGVQQIIKKKDHYIIHTKTNTYKSRFLISGIPINNMMTLAPEIISPGSKRKILTPDKLYSAFQMGIVFKSQRHFESIHHQIHLSEPLPETHSNSIFMSLNHEADLTRSSVPETRVASISTHISNPLSQVNTAWLEAKIIDALEARGFLRKTDIIYAHSSGPKSWAKWTGRAHGFVGGYPQYHQTKPWQMIGARLDGYRAYQCGDTAYPGQGIPGVTLSGMTAAKRLINDWI